MDELEKELQLRGGETSRSESLQSYYMSLNKQLVEMEKNIETLAQENRLLKKQYHELLQVFSVIVKSLQSNVETYTKLLDDSQISLQITQMLMSSVSPTPKRSVSFVRKSSPRQIVTFEPQPGPSQIRSQPVKRPYLNIKPLNLQQVDEELRKETEAEATLRSEHNGGFLSTIQEETMESSASKMKELIVKLNRLSQTVLNNHTLSNSKRQNGMIESPTEANFTRELSSSTPLTAKINSLRHLGLVPVSEVEASTSRSSPKNNFVTARRKIIASPVSSAEETEEGAAAAAAPPPKNNNKKQAKAKPKSRKKGKPPSEDVESPESKRKREGESGSPEASSAKRPLRKARPVKPLKEPSLSGKMRQ